MTKNQNQIVPVEVQQKCREDAGKLSLVANKIVVTSASQEEAAYDALTKIKIAIGTIETERKKITAPLNQSLKAANTMFKTLSEPFKTADSIIRSKMMEFRQIQFEKAEKEQERREKIQASHEAKGHQTHDLEEVVPEVAEKTVVAKVWKIRITDLTKIPIPIVMHFLNEEGREAIEKYLRRRLRESERDNNNKPLIEIPGTEVYQEEGLRV